MKRTLQLLGIVLIVLVTVALVYYILTYEPSGASGGGSEGPPVTVTTNTGDGVVDLVTWNIANLGGSKSDAEIEAMARQLRGQEVVAVQEVITSPPGAQAVARLADALSRTGERWDFRLSDPTSGRGSERYAYFWRPAEVRLVGRPWLEASLAEPLDREPFLARFESGGHVFLAASFHAVPRSKDPASENILLDVLHAKYPGDALVIMGDFNLPQQNEAFDGLRRAGYAAALSQQKTTIRMQRKEGEALANPYDNIFYETGPLRLLDAGVIDFTGQFRTLRDARAVSDHLPVYARVTWR